MHSTWAEMLSVIAEVDSRSIAATVGYGTTLELVRAVARVSRGEARARVAAAADVLAGRGLGGAPVEPRLPATAVAGSRARDWRGGCRGDPLGTGAHPAAHR